MGKLENIKFVCHNLVVKDKLILKGWNKDTNEGGCIQIKCSGTLTIERNKGLIADGCGYSAGYGIGKATSVFSGASFGINGGENLNNLHYGSPDGLGKGGGIIEIIAECLINKGEISCCGTGSASGGTINIMVKSMENFGKICANGGLLPYSDGRITIFCEEEMVNKGSIEPKPFVSQSFIFSEDI